MELHPDAQVYGVDQLVHPDDLLLFCSYCTGVYRPVEDGLEFVCLHGGD